MRSDEHQAGTIATQVALVFLTLWTVGPIADAVRVAAERDLMRSIPVVVKEFRDDGSTDCGPHVFVLVRPGDAKLLYELTFITGAAGKGSIEDLRGGLVRLVEYMPFVHSATILVDDEVMHEELVEILDACRENGLTRLVVMPMLD